MTQEKVVNRDVFQKVSSEHIEPSTAYYFSKKLVMMRENTVILKLFIVRIHFDLL